MHRLDVAQAQPRHVLEAVQDDERLAEVAGHRVQGLERALGGGLVAGHELGDDVDLAVTGAVRQRATEGGRDHLLVGALGVVARRGAVHDATAGPDRRTARAVTGTTGALLAPRLGATAADLAAGLGVVRALAGGGQLGHDDLVDQGDIGVRVEQRGGEVGLAGLLALGVDHVNSQIAHAASPFLAALRTTTRDPLLPGMAPRTSSRPRSASTA